MEGISNTEAKIIEREIESLGKMVHTQGNRFDRHLEIYAQNGKELSALKTEMKSMGKNLVDALSQIRSSIEKQEKLHVSRTEFLPVKKVVYGFVSVVLVTVVGALLTFIVMNPQTNSPAVIVPSDAIRQALDDSFNVN